MPTRPTRQPDHTQDNSWPSAEWEVQRVGNDEYDGVTASFVKEGYSPEEGPGSDEFVEEFGGGGEEFEPVDDEGFDGAGEYAEDEGFGEGFANDHSFEWEGKVEPFREPGEEFFFGGEKESFFEAHKKHVLIASSALAVAIAVYFYYKRR